MVSVSMGGGSQAEESTELPMTTIIFLVISNIFMTLAWSGHLKLKAKPLLFKRTISYPEVM